MNADENIVMIAKGSSFINWVNWGRRNKIKERKWKRNDNEKEEFIVYPEKLFLNYNKNDDCNNENEKECKKNKERIITNKVNYCNNNEYKQKENICSNCVVSFLVNINDIHNYFSY